MSDATAILKQRPVWFEPFLQQVKIELGYPIDIGKFSQLLTWANNNNWSAGEETFEKLYNVCRVLFLQNPQHENRFLEIFKSYLVDELTYEQAQHQLKKEKVTRRDELATDKKENNSINKENTTSDIETTELEKEPPEDSTQSKIAEKKYLNFTIPFSEAEEETRNGSSANSRYLLSDAYFPLTSREMIHGWRHLRKRERYEMSNRLDVPATVRQIATQGVLLNPVFEHERINSDDLLVIFADRRGSMTPFHKVTDKLIETAIKEGGHKNAMIYYFSNCPTDVVYKKSTLTEPVPLTQLYGQIRPDHTNALIISDAGAARGNMNAERIERTKAFLYGKDSSNEGLHKRALFVAWLNPMPQHRWANSSAESLARDITTPMVSLMDDGYKNFLHLIQTLMGK